MVVISAINKDSVRMLEFLDWIKESSEETKSTKEREIDAQEQDSDSIIYFKLRIYIKGNQDEKYKPLYKLFMECYYKWVETPTFDNPRNIYCLLNECFRMCAKAQQHIKIIDDYDSEGPKPGGISPPSKSQQRHLKQNDINHILKDFPNKNQFSTIHYRLKTTLEKLRSEDEFYREIENIPENLKDLMDSMESFNWLHLTDLHCGMKTQDWLWPNLKDIFFDDLERLHAKCGPWDLVLFTGDLTNRGKKEEFKKVDIILKQILNKLKNLGSTPKLLTVPGNHDLVRLSESDKKKPAALLLQEWTEREDIKKDFWDNIKSDYHKVIGKAFKNYTTWWENQTYIDKETLNAGILPGDFSTTIEKNGAKLGIVGLNTSFLQLTNKDYYKKLALHPSQFLQMCKNGAPEWTKQHHVCLLLTHHPPDWLDPNCEKILAGEIKAKNRFPIHLCGHMHESLKTKQGLLQCRSLFGLEHYGIDDSGTREHGYTAGRIKLSKDKGKLVYWPREAIHEHTGEWKIKQDLSFEGISNTVWHTEQDFDLNISYKTIMQKVEERFKDRWSKATPVKSQKATYTMMTEQKLQRVNYEEND